MTRFPLRALVALSLAVALAACSGTPSPAVSAVPVPAAASPVSPAPVAATPSAPAGASPAAAQPSGLPQLVFFMNPNGAPCQAQDKILQGMTDEMKGKVELVYRKVTVPEDRDAFAKAGVHGLPSLLLYDGSGKELSRTTPGIQDADRVRALLAAR